MVARRTRRAYSNMKKLNKKEKLDHSYDHLCESYRQSVQECMKIVADFLLDDNGDPIFIPRGVPDIKAVSAWKRGLIPTKSLIKTFNTLNKEEEADVVIKEDLIMLKNCLDMASDEVSRTLDRMGSVKHNYTRYLRNLNSYLQELYSNEKQSKDIGFIHIYENEISDPSVSDRTYDQTIKFINSRNINDKSKEKYSKYGVALVFESDKRKHTFIGPKEYVTALKNEFSINRNKIDGKKEEWLDHINKTINDHETKRKEQKATEA